MGAVLVRLQYPGGPGGFDISSIRPTVLEDMADVEGAATYPDDYGGLKLKCEASLAEAWTRCAPTPSCSHAKNTLHAYAFVCAVADYNRDLHRRRPVVFCRPMRCLGKFPYTTLRPPSVIGPACDNRHERLQRLAMGIPALDPRGGRKFAQERGGFRVAYSEDMATAVVATLEAGEAALNEAFNIAMDEVVTVNDYLAGVRNALMASGCPCAPKLLSVFATLVVRDRITILTNHSYTHAGKATNYVALSGALV